MSLDLRDVNYIEIPESGSLYKSLGIWFQNDPKVDKITDSNGNMIWGRRNKYPYRLLEYIHFNGSEYITTTKPDNRYYYLDFSLDSIVNDKFIFATNGDSTTDGTMRLTNRTSSSGYLQARCGRNSSSNTNIAQVSTDTYYELRFRIFSTNSVYCALANQSGTVLGYQNIITGSFTRYNMNTFAIMGYNNGGTVGNSTAGKVYRYYVRSGDGSSEIVSNCYPCQRKSDNVCGLYDVIQSKFYPMQGTTITSGAAGPVIDEYWNMQYPIPDYYLLNYIDIPSGCYISTNDNGQSVMEYYLDVNWNLDNDSLSTDQFPFGSIYYDGSTYYRYHLIMNNASGMRAAYGNGGFTSLFSISDSNQRHVIELDYHTPNDDKAYCDGFDKGAFTPTAGTNTGIIYIGGRRFDNNGTVTINDYQHTIRVYDIRARGTATNPLTYFYPVQRKSDGKVGLLKVYNQGQAVRFCTTETSVEPIAGNRV